jgi:lysine 2,3-aminomutase
MDTAEQMKRQNPYSRKTVLRQATDLVEAGLVTGEQAPLFETLASHYAMALTPDLLALIDRENPDDPIRKQFVPDPRELQWTADEINDPIGDWAHEKTDGLIHRYEDKALLKIVGTCPVYCRFCFRREMVGPEKGENLTAQKIDAALDYLAATPMIREVILTGGDPLILSIPRLQKLGLRLRDIPHLANIRWHSRLPVASPYQVSDAMAEALIASGKTTRLALHINHPHEFSHAVRQAIATLQRHQIEVLSQSVLLAGVNTDLATLAALKRCFDETGITPYYMHHPDLAKGTSHFRFPLAQGIALMRAWRDQNPAQALPRYMLDLPGGFGKVDLLSPAVSMRDAETFEITDRKGRVHVYQSVASPLKSTT